MKNYKVSIYQKRTLVYCEKHQTQLEEHKKSHTCRITCQLIRKLKQSFKDCEDCQILSARQPKKIRTKIKCEQVVDLIITKPEDKKEDLTLLLIKRDNSCEKRTLTMVKNPIWVDTKYKKTDYCKKHWFNLGKLTDKLTNETAKLEEERGEIEKNVLKSELPLKDKEKILKSVRVMSGSEITKSLERKIANSSVDLTLGPAAREELIKNLLEGGKKYKSLLVEKKETQRQHRIMKHNELSTFLLPTAYSLPTVLCVE